MSSFTQNTRTVSYAYDATGRLSTMSYPAGFAVSYHYDADGQLTAIKKNGAALATYAYDNVGRLSTRTLSNGVVTTFGYDALDRANAISLSKNGVALWSHGYGFDAIGNRLWTQAGNGLGDVYGYDAVSQLTGVKYQTTNPIQGFAGASNPAWMATYGYDPAGNRVQATEAAASTVYTVNNVNQYTLLAQSGTNAVPTYSAQGNLMSHAGWAYTYDAEVHLIAATDGTTTAQYEYDGLGQRVGKKLGAAQVAWHLNSGLNLIESYHVGSSLPTSYLHEPGLNRPLATVAPNGDVSFHHQDILGNVIALTDASGSLVEEYRYSVWGQPTIYRNGQTQGANSEPESAFLFTGHQYDFETKLHFARARTYSASLGRWLSRDPIEEEGGLNLFGYVLNDPINLIDELGMAPRGPNRGGGRGGNRYSHLPPSMRPFQIPLSSNPMRPSPLTGAEAARAALGKGPNANPGAPLTPEMRCALQQNLTAAQQTLNNAKNGINNAGNPISPGQQEAVSILMQSRVNNINTTLESGVQAPQN